jgi:transaldolase
VREIYNYYKRHGYKTIVMGASFRSYGEALELAGCDFLTLSPAILTELKARTGAVERKLDATTAAKAGRDKVHLDVGSAGPFHKPPGEGDGATGLPDFC